ncbi:MAG: phosphoribosylaminoimidazolesuccinocarboxamide synthase, partial [Burkholderiales bacterium]|nr:phosphoribosylaminoimidazolesuccinocarboxamide synthase [Burkholderiales bacterium]
MQKGAELYRGKAKTVYATDDAHYLIMHYRDDVSAFDGAKLAKLERKGETNNRINAYVMGKLAAAGVPTHFVRLIDDRESLVHAMKMIPVECVVRNVCAGSMATRYGVAEGLRLPEPVFEFFYKSDALHDPLCN